MAETLSRSRNISVRSGNGLWITDSPVRGLVTIRVSRPRPGFSPPVADPDAAFMGVTTDEWRAFACPEFDEAVKLLQEVDARPGTFVDGSPGIDRLHDFLLRIGRAP